jgi:hypothetical protein
MDPGGSSVLKQPRLEIHQTFNELAIGLLLELKEKYIEFHHECQAIFLILVKYSVRPSVWRMNVTGAGSSI